MKSTITTIDFLGPRTGLRGPWSWMAAAALLVLAALVVYAAAAQARIAALEAEVTALQGADFTLAGEEGEIELDDGQVFGVNAAVRRLNFPWEALFGSLAESLAAQSTTRNLHVTLLELRQDTSDNLLRLTAESRTTDGMLRFQELLRSSPAISIATITKHEVVSDDPQRPIRFWLDVRVATGAGAP